MEEIKNFVISFTKQEAEAIYLRRQPNLDEYNNALKTMNNYCVEALHDSFGMIQKTELYNQEYYDTWSKKKNPNPRHIYKISHYKEDSYGDVYVVYISERNPNDEIFLYGKCLFVTNINDNLKIIKSYSFGDEMLVKDKFEGGQGLEDISFKTLKKPILIERYLEPLDDKDGMEHYLKNV